MSIGQILKEFNTTRYHVDRLLKKYNIPKNPELNDNLKHEAVKKITKEQFYQLYSIDGKTYSEIAEIYGVTVSQLKKLNAKFKCPRDSKVIVAQRAATFEEKYGEGITCARQVKEIQEKIVAKYKATYGVENPSQNKEVQEKRRKVFIERYGVENPFSNKEVQKKIKKHYSDKYGEGIINPSQVPEINKRITRSNRYIMALKSGLHTENDIKTVDSAENLKEFILSLPEVERNMTQIGKLLNYDDSIIGKYVHKYHLEDIIVPAGGTSSYEEEIYQYLIDLGITTIERNVVGLLEGRLELDLYIPDLKIAIEFNGNYWHSEREKNIAYHQKKSLAGEKAGIFIYNIYEYEWNNRGLRDIIKSQLAGLLNKHSKVYARKCKIVEIDSKEKSIFLNDNHLQGNDSSMLSLGLKYNSELIAVMTFCKPRFSKKDNWELSRFCVKQGTSIIGGASKLFRYFVNNVLKTDESVITYSDIGKATGKVYGKLGFKLVSTSKPGYVWWGGHQKIKSRYQCQMKNEIETMQSQGYVRIFNSGNKVWRFKKEV